MADIRRQSTDVKEKVAKSKFSESALGKSAILIVTGLALFIVFHIPLNNLLDNTLVEFALKYVQSEWYNDLIFLGVFVISIIFFIGRLKNYIPSITTTRIFLLVTTIYLFYRISDSYWEFRSLWLTDQIKYLDLLVFITALQTILQFKKRAKKIDKECLFVEDIPLGETGEEKLGYKEYAKEIAFKIVGSYFKKSFAVGINGKWGSGKTSFIDLIKRELKEETIIPIDFNAWNSQTPNGIIKDFFATIQGAIRPYHSSLARRLIQYSNRIAEVNNTKVTQFLSSTINILFGTASLEKIHEDIEESLKQIGKKLVIYIDDLDRLDTDEIVEVFRLIRNTANFSNTVFIVAYDKDYINNALKKHNSFNKEEFLEKIFQIEITLPYFEAVDLIDDLISKLENKISPESLPEIKRALDGNRFIKPKYLYNWIENIRDANRLVNSVLLNYPLLENEVVFSDFLRIELLRLKYPSIYYLISKRTNDFFTLESKNFSLKKRKYRLKILDEASLNHQKSRDGMVLGEYLRNNYRQLSLQKESIPKIISLLNEVFPSSSYNFGSSSHLSIVYPKKFPRYFKYGLLKEDLSETEFNEAIKSDTEDLYKYIDKTIKNGIAYKLQERFIEVKDFENRDEFEKIIKAIFYLGGSLKKPFTGKHIYDDLLNKLNNYENIIVQRFYMGNNGLKIYKNFLYSLFENAKSPYLFEANFIENCNKNEKSPIELRKPELLKFAIGYLEKYSKKASKINSNLWHLYHTTKVTEWVANHQGGYTTKIVESEKAKSIFKNFILTKDVDGFLLNTIQKAPFTDSSYNISFTPIFENQLDFEQTILNGSHPNSKYIQEYRKFYKELELNGYKPIHFDFRIIPVDEKFKQY